MRNLFVIMLLWAHVCSLALLGDDSSTPEQPSRLVGCIVHLWQKIGRVRQPLEPKAVQDISAPVTLSDGTQVMVTVHIENYGPNLFTVTERSDQSRNDMRETLAHGPLVDDARVVQIAIHGMSASPRFSVNVQDPNVSVPLDPAQVVESLKTLGLELDDAQVVVLHSCHSGCSGLGQAVADHTHLPVIAPTGKERLVRRSDRWRDGTVIRRNVFQVRDPSGEEPWVILEPKEPAPGVASADDLEALKEFLIRNNRQAGSSEDESP